MANYLANQCCPRGQLIRELIAKALEKAQNLPEVFEWQEQDRLFYIRDLLKNFEDEVSYRSEIDDEARADIAAQFEHVRGLVDEVERTARTVRKEAQELVGEPLVDLVPLRRDPFLRNLRIHEHS